jgi:D-alanyl-D-alanine carboxypeptidase
MKRLIIILALGLFSCIHLISQEINKEELDSLFSVIEYHNKGMGSVSLFKDGKEIYSNHYGFARLNSQTKINENTTFRIGSISKTFTAAIIMKLAEEGKLSLDDSLNDFYPQIVNAEKITIEDLLRHRSGIYNFTNSKEFQQLYTQKMSKKELLSFISSFKEAAFEPKTKTEYSNTNYILLTFIAEDVSGKSYSRLLNNYIIKPIGLKKTYLGRPKKHRNEAYSYKWVGEWELEKGTHLSIPLGAGALLSTPYELNVFIYKLFHSQIVSKESLAKMVSIEDGFGIGLFQVPFYDLKALGHNGGIDGFQANAFFFPDYDFSVALSSSAVVYPMNDILIGVLSSYFEKEYKLPEFKKTIQVNPDELEKFTGVYSSVGVPMPITVRKKGNVLTGQGKGQSEFTLDAIETNVFIFEPANLILEFVPMENKMILKQRGATIIFNRTQETVQQQKIISRLEIYSIGDDQREVVKEFNYRIEAPNWTPDGKYLVYNSLGLMYKIPVEGGEAELINTGSIKGINNDHVISADGNLLAISAKVDTFKSRIYTVPFSGGEPKLITEKAPSFLHGISPDNKFLSYCAEREGNYDVYIIPTEGGDEIRLTDAPGLDDGPEFSPDGRYIWFNSVRTGLMQVWRMKVDGSEQTQMTFSRANNWFPHISPDGNHVVFISYKEGDVAPGSHPANKNVEILIMPASGGEAKTLLKLFGGQGSLNVNSWSPDSKKFAFVSYELVSD